MERAFPMGAPTGTDSGSPFPPQPANPGQEGPPRGRNELILVVDDEKTVLKVVRATLERFGYRVLTAANGAEALALFDSNRASIAAVFTDLAMPVMDGIVMAAAIRAIDPRAKIIASSGLGAKYGSLDEAIPGLCGFIAKPYTADELLGVLSRVLHGGPGGS